MKKQYIIALSGLAIIASGCAVGGKKQVNQNQEAQTQNQTQAAEVSGDRFAAFENMPKASISDITAGLAVLVMGAQNEDGSVSADRILLADDASAFEQMQMRVSRTDSSSVVEGTAGDATSQNQPADNQEIEAQQFNRGNFDPAQFQNMSEQERAQMREQFQQQPGANGDSAGATRQIRAFGAGRGGMSPVIGEVLKKDSASMVIKVADGSKIVFFSDETAINRFEPQEQ